MVYDIYNNELDYTEVRFKHLETLSNFYLKELKINGIKNIFVTSEGVEYTAKLLKLHSDNFVNDKETQIYCDLLLKDLGPFIAANLHSH